MILKKEYLGINNNIKNHGKFKKLIVVEIKIEESIEVTGGTFGYDVGWAFYWGAKIATNSLMSSVNIILAQAAYDAHYK